MANPGRHGVWEAPPWRKIKGTNGESDIDISAAVYTNFTPLLTISNPSARAFIEDCWVFIDLDKATTGFIAVHAAETITFAVARKVDGTNWRVDQNANGGAPVTAVAGTLATSSPMVGIRVGPIGPDEDCRIDVQLSAEVADTELPYVIYYRGPKPTITEVSA